MRDLYQMLLGYLLQGLPSFLEHKLLQEILFQECLNKVHLIEENNNQKKVGEAETVVLH